MVQSVQTVRMSVRAWERAQLKAFGHQRREREWLKERNERYAARPRGRIGKMLFVSCWFLKGGGVWV